MAAPSTPAEGGEEREAGMEMAMETRRDAAGTGAVSWTSGWGTFPCLAQPRFLVNNGREFCPQSLAHEIPDVKYGFPSITTPERRTVRFSQRPRIGANLKWPLGGGATSPPAAAKNSLPKRGKIQRKPQRQENNVLWCPAVFFCWRQNPKHPPAPHNLQYLL